MEIEFLVPLFFVFLTGLCFGSFLNVVVLRAFSNESISYPASKCPKCQKPLYWWHNIPVLSYIMLRGKCYFCKSPISIQYPIVEFVTAVLFSLAYLKFGFGIHLIYLWAVIFMALVLAVADIKEKVIFTRHVYVLAGIGLFYNFLYTMLNIKEPAITWLNNPFVNSIEGLLLGAVVMLVYFLIAGLLAGGKMAMGDGDIYIAGALGACLGFEKTAYMLIFAFLLQILITLIAYEYSLFKAKDFKIFASVILFIIIGIGHCFLNNAGIFAQNTVIFILYTIILMLVALYILKDTFARVWNLKDKNPDAVLENFVCIPFGPALVATAITVLFYLPEISVISQNFINSYLNFIGW